MTDVVLFSPDRLRAAYVAARDALLSERVASGHWTGELSTSALSTATAVMAFHLANPFEHRACIDMGIRWLTGHQNHDGGWGDTTRSFSNISTSMLCRAAFRMTGAEKEYPDAVERLEEYLSSCAGRLPTRRAEAIRRRYGRDRTFSVPILMTSALAGLVPWDEVPRLPFELACLPQSWYRFARLPVVSYALPALIAIGQCVHAHRPTSNLYRRPVRWLARTPSLRVLRRIQPASGGYLEAIPLTSFVVMALASIRRKKTAAEQQVIENGLGFLVRSMRPGGSWPIDANLATWVTTLAVNALHSAGDLASLDSADNIRNWLLNQQYRVRHPYTGADPGAWAWTDLPGGVPDGDDTPGAMLALMALGVQEGMAPARDWLGGLQNRDGGWPTFCRGWGTLPFDRSGADLTAHALRALGALPRDDSNRYRPRIPQQVDRGFAYLSRQQQTDGSWLPLWFGNQHAPDDVNPVYGTARVLAAYRDLNRSASDECVRGVRYLLAVQNVDGGWGGAKDCPSSVEETALAVEVLLDLAPGEAVQKGVAWLIEAVESGRFHAASPIGFYFAKLWYYEKLYPLIFTVAALGRARQRIVSG